MGDFNIIEVYIARFKNLKADTVQVGGKRKTDPELVNIALNDLSNIEIFCSYGLQYPFICQGSYNSYS